jgi:2'-5' RNA ligase
LLPHCCGGVPTCRERDDVAHRLFVSIMLEPELAARLAELATPDRPGLLHDGLLPAHRLVAEDHLHLTLVFLGDRHKNELTEIHESVERAVSGQRAFELCTQRLMTLPRRQTPRLLAAVTDEPPTLLEIHRRLVSRLIRPVLREKKTTPFLPHVTLLRYEPGTSPPDVELPLDEAEQVRITVGEVHLVESIATMRGAEYRIVRAFPLREGK